MEYSVTNFDIERILGNNTATLYYKDLKDYPNFKDLFKKFKYVFILYNWGGNYGHWTCLFLRPPDYNTVEFFDPLGIMPDREILDIPKKIRQKYKMSVPLLTLLMQEWPGNIEYNNYKFQKNKKGVNTCGRWCIFRCLNYGLDIDEFKKYIDSFGVDNKDELIVELTNPIILNN
jgi:hypothetical protein